MKENKPEKIIKILSDAQTVGLMAHADADGDAFGSMLAIQRALSQFGKKVNIYSNEELSEEFGLLFHELAYSPNVEFQNEDVLLCLDFSSEKRGMLPEVIAEFKKAQKKVLAIDHHRPLDMQDVADIYWGDESASSTCELVFTLFKMWDYKIDKTTAKFLLFGLETDTSYLQNPATSEKAYQTASELLKLGARVKPVVDLIQRRSLPSVKLIGRVLKRLHLNKKYNIAATYVTQKDAKELALDESVSAGLSNYLDQVRESGNIIVFAETETGKIKVSMRSNRSNANVGKLAEMLGGGGHAKAAGFEFKGDIEKLIK